MSDVIAKNVHLLFYILFWSLLALFDLISEKRLIALFEVTTVSVDFVS